MSETENPLLLTSLAGVIQRNRSIIGIYLNEDYAKKVNDIPEIMFLEIEYKGLRRLVLILQQEIGKIRLKEIEDKIRKTEVGKNGIEFDFLSILEKDYLKEIRRQLIRGYSNGWHTYMMYLEEEQKIGIRVVIKEDEKLKLMEREHVKLIRLKDIQREENTMLRIRSEKEMNVISNMKRVQMKPKLETRDWYNKYSKNFLRNILQIEKITKRVTINERVMYYKEPEESESEEINKLKTEGDELSSIEV